MPDVLSVKPDAIQLDDDDLLHYSNVLTSDLSEARSDMRGAMREIEEFREYLRARQPRKNPPWEGASELVAPYAQQTVQALLAEVGPALLNVDPLSRYAHVGGRDQGDASELWESFNEALYRRKTQFRQSMTNLYHRSFIDSAAVMQTTWDVREAWRYGWQTQTANQLDPMTGMTHQVVTSIEAAKAITTVYDFPRFDVIPIDQFCVFPACNADIQESAGVAARFEVSAHTILNGIRQKTYDKTQGLRVLEYYDADSEVRSPDDKQHRVGGQNSDTDQVRQSVQLTECYFRLPGKGKNSPPEDWLFTIHEFSGVILRARPIPWWHGLRPFSLCRPYPDAAGILGYSVMSGGAAHIQDAKTTLLRLAIDAMSLGINPRILVAQSIYNKSREALQKGNRPGGLIPLPDQIFATRGQNIQPFSQGYNPSTVIPLLELLDSEAQRVFPDSASGAQMPGSPTATEAQRVAEGANKLIAQVVENCAYCQSDVMQQSHELVRQFMGRESIQKLWHEVNGEHGMPIEIAAQAEYYIEANGISETNSMSVKAQRAQMMAAYLKDEPHVMGNPMKRYKLRQYVLQRQGVNSRDLDSIMGTVEEWQQEEQMMQQSNIKQQEIELKKLAEENKNLRHAASLQTKRASDHENAQMEMLKAGLTTPLPEEQVPDAPALAPLEGGQPGASSQGGAPGAPPSSSPLSSLNGPQLPPDAQPGAAPPSMEETPAPGQEMP